MKEVKSEIEKKLENLLVSGGGLNPNPQDKYRFFEFVITCHKAGYLMEKKDFVKLCKTHTHCTRTQNRGICQKAYREYELLYQFLKYLENNH